MKFTKEFKLEMVKKYLNGEMIPMFGNGTRHNCSKTVRTWVKLYNYHGEEGLSHRYHKRTVMEKKNAVERFLAGESKQDIAASLGIATESLHTMVSRFLMEPFTTVETSWFLASFND